MLSPLMITDPQIYNGKPYEKPVKHPKIKKWQQSERKKEPFLPTDLAQNLDIDCPK